MKRAVMSVVMGLVVIAMGAAAWGQTEAATAYARPLKGITIDGKLDDWPKDMVRYPVCTGFRVYGPTDVDLADLTTSKDLSPSFMVGYSAQENLIYVAAIVRDDIHTVNRGGENTDAMEIYLDGSNARRDIPAAHFGDATCLQNCCTSQPTACAARDAVVACACN